MKIFFFSSSRKLLLIICISLFAISACKKELRQGAIQANKPPVAHAGADIWTELSCSNKTGYTELIGSGSYDPDGNIVSYSWVGISGTPGYLISDSSLAKTWAHNFSPGEYAFELTVKDASGLSSKDTVLVRVTGAPGFAREYDLDIILTTYGFDDNFYDYSLGGYYAETNITGKTIIHPLGVFNVNVWEWADTAALSDQVYGTEIYIECNNTLPFRYIAGDFVGINFKKLIRQGGGSFTGTATMRVGSAKSCDPNINIFSNLPPLTITGSLDVATHTVSLRIKGKVYF